MHTTTVNFISQTSTKMNRKLPKTPNPVKVIFLTQILQLNNWLLFMLCVQKALWAMFINNVTSFRRGLMSTATLNAFKTFFSKEVQRELESKSSLRLKGHDTQGNL